MLKSELWGQNWISLVVDTKSLITWGILTYYLESSSDNDEID